MAKKQLTQRQRLLKRLSSGKNLYASEAKKMKISNLRARICELRETYEIYTNTVNGRTAYRLDTKSTPVRELF